MGLRFLCTMGSPEMIWFIVVWILPVGAPRAPWTFEEKEKKKQLLSSLSVPHAHVLFLCFFLCLPPTAARPGNHSLSWD